MEQANRRKHPRFAVAREVQVRLASGSRPVALQDLSLGGAKVESSEPLGAWGDAITLALPVGSTGKAELRIPSTIVRTWPTPAGQSCGLRFDTLGPAERVELETLLGQL